MNIFVSFCGNHLAKERLNSNIFTYFLSTYFPVAHIKLVQRTGRIDVDLDLMSFKNNKHLRSFLLFYII